MRIILHLAATAPGGVTNTILQPGDSILTTPNNNSSSNVAPISSTSPQASTLPGESNSPTGIARLGGDTTATETADAIVNIGRSVARQGLRTGKVTFLSFDIEHEGKECEIV